MKNPEDWKPEKLSEVRDRSSSEQADRQARNRSWWETLPMTYEDWGAERRDPETPEDFRAVNHQSMACPYLERFSFQDFRGKKVLEIGCGAGAASCRFALAGAHVTAVDLTEKAVGLTGKNAAYQGLTIECRRMDAEQLEFADESFDFVYSWGVLHHSSDTERAFAQAFRVLRKGGRSMFMVYHRNSVRYYVKGLAYLLLKGKILRGHGFKSVQGFYTDGFYHRHFSRSELAAVLGRIGFHVERVLVTHMNTPMVPWVGSRIRSWLKSRWGWLLVAECEKR